MTQALQDEVFVSGVTVPRRRCLAKLRRLERQISWITAPAGTGKSHLVRQVAADFVGTAVLLQIEEGDDDPGRFFHRLARAVMKTRGAGSLPSFGPEDLIYLHSFACRFFAPFEQRAASDVLFVFDDMHHLGQAPELLEALACAVAKLPAHVSFVIASRDAPPGSWARFLADGRMAKLGPDILLMDAEEIRRLLLAHSDWRHGTDDATISELLAATQGWASGLGVLIELAKTRQGQGRSFGRAEARDLVFENFSDRVVASFSPAEQRHLMLVAPCEVLYPAILRELFGGELCELLERLCLNNMLVAKDYADSAEAEPRYRLHALLRDFLRHKARRDLDPSELRDACTRMAGRLLATGEDDAARTLLLEAKDWPRLADHLEDAAESLYASGRIRSLARFLNALPAAIRDKSIQLGYWRGLCLLHIDPGESRRELTAAYDRFKACGDHAATIRAWGALVDTIWFEWEDCARFDPYIDDLPELRAIAETLNDPELMTILTRGAFAALSLRRPDHPDFDDWEARNLALFQRRLPRSERIRRGLQLMIHYVYGSGERRKAEVVRTRLQQLYESDSESAADHCGYYVVNTAYKFWFSPDGTQAPASAATGLAVTQRLKLPFWDVPLLNAALFRVASDEAVENLRNMLALLDERLSPESREHDIAISHHFTAYLAWLEGDNEKALFAIEAAYQIALDSGFAMSPIYYGVGKAVILDSLGRRREALRHLSLARHGAVNQNSRCMSFMTHMAGAAIALRAGRTAFTLSYIRRAFEVGEHEGFCAVLWLRLADRNRLCDMAVENGISPDFARALKSAAGSTTVAAEQPVVCCALGRADILRDGRSELTSRKPQVMPLLLMLHLIAAGERGETSDRLIDAVWPDADPESGRQRLKTTLYRLRKLVGDPKAISSCGGLIRIDASRVDVDAWTVEALVAAQGDEIARAETALDLYQGGFVDLYAGHTDLLIYREQVAQKVESLVLRAGKILADQEAWDRAAALFEKGLERFGYHEAFHACLKDCLGKAGRKDALRRLDGRWDAEDW